MAQTMAKPLQRRDDLVGGAEMLIEYLDLDVALDLDQSAIVSATFW